MSCWQGKKDSIYYWLPGLRIEYRGDPKSMLAWLRLTWRAGLAAWSIWFRCARFLWSVGVVPYPSFVSVVFLEVFRNYVEGGEIPLEDAA